MRGQTNALPPDAVRTTGDQTIDGIKDFLKTLFVSSDQTGDTAKGYFTKTSDNQNDYIRLGVQSQIAGYEFGELRLTINKSNGTCALYIGKRINGVYTQSLISSL